VRLTFGKCLLYLTVMLVMAVVSISAMLIFGDTPVTEPERPEKVPDSAIWYGGPDGGVFIKVDDNQIRKNHFYCTLYFDYTGDIWYEGLFEYNGDSILSVETLRKIISAYDGYRIHLWEYGFLTKVKE